MISSARVGPAHSSLQAVIDPVSTDAFFERYWEANPLVIARKRPEYFERLPSLDDVDRVLTTLPSRYPDVTLAQADKELTSEQYTDRLDNLDVAKVYELFSNGASVILNQLHTCIPSLGALCRALEAELSAPVQTNAYLTPARSKGFPPHFDSHDVFVLQLTGSKRWRLYGTPITIPHRGQTWDSKVHGAGAITQEFDIHPGDTAYIPRGLVHDAQTEDDISLHVTVGLMTYTWTDLLLDALAAISLTDPTFRKSLPPGFSRPDFDRSNARRLFRGLATRFSTAADFDSALDHYVDEFIVSRRPLLRNQMTQIAALDSLCLSSVVGIRENLIYRLYETAGLIRMVGSEREIVFPPHAAEALRFMLGRSAFRVQDLPGALDDPGKLALVRRLIREGFLVIGPGATLDI